MKRLYIVGLGRGDAASLSVLFQGELAEVQTYICSGAPPQLEEFIKEKGGAPINLETWAGLERSLSFSQRREKILTALLRTAAWGKPAALVVPGRPWPGDFLLGLLRRDPAARDLTVQHMPGEEIMIDLMERVHSHSKEKEKEKGWDEGPLAFSRGVTFFDASWGEELKDPPRGELFISQVYSRSLLVKLVERLCHIYPPQHPVALWQFDGQGEPRYYGSWNLADIGTGTALPPLHAWSFLHLAPPLRCSLGDMTAMMAELRSPGGCPWDREQDHRSLRPYLLEETHEVLEAIDSGVAEDLCEELGDLLLQIVFHSELAREKGIFSFWEVVDGIARKIYRRHPHVFQQEKLADARAVSRRWQELKGEEKRKSEKGGKEARLFDLPPGLPALMKAQKVQRRAALLGFDWPHAAGALDKVGEELRELEAERIGGNKKKVEEEYGDLLFALVNVARFLGVDAEQSLAAATRKFIRRFKYIEEKVKASGKDFQAFSLADLDHFWEEAKIQE